MRGIVMRSFFICLAASLCTVLFVSSLAFAKDLHKHHQIKIGEAGVVHASAIKSGDCLDPQTWRDGEIPQANSDVLIAKGVNVYIRNVVPTDLNTIVVDGQLLLPGQQSAKLSVRTIRINDDGALLIGSKDQPVNADSVVEIEFLGLPQTPIGLDDISGGLVSTGRVDIFGSNKSAYTMSKNRLAAGEDEFLFQQVDGWRVGDELLFPATELKHEDEVRVISSIDSSRAWVKLDRPLDNDHVLPSLIDAGVPVGNLTRNVIIGTRADVPISRRAHTMFMNQQSVVTIEGASFSRMGRTNAKRTHTNMIEDGLPTELINTIGRYSIHFHMRKGAVRTATPQTVENSVVRDCAKHGVVNHGGNVEATYNVTFRCDGSHFFAENGSEVGKFEHNLAVRSNGSGDRFIDREASADFGHGGHGFWMQGGGGVSVNNNFAFGHSDAAYFYFGQYMKEDGKVVYFDPANILDPTVISDSDRILPRDIPIRFVGNVGVASGRGLDIWNHKERATHNVPSLIKDSSFYANKLTAIFIPYSKNMIIDNIVAIGSDGFKGIGLNTNVKTAGLDILNSYISGYAVGIELPRHGVTSIDGLTLKNAINVRASSALSRNRKIEFRNLNFIEMPEWASLTSQTADKVIDELRYLKRPQYDFYLEGVKPTERGDLSMVFEPTEIYVESGRNDYVGKQIYFPEQAKSVVPFEKIDVAELAGKTNGELWEKYKLAVGGAIAPADSIKHRRVKGLVGDKVSYLPPIPDKYFEIEPTVYKGNYLKEFDDSKYTEGWNFLSVNIDGDARTVMLYADSVKPTLELDPRVPLVIHPDDVRFGLRLQGDVIDYVGGIRTVNTVNREYRDLVVSENGLINVEYPVVDAAGNINNVKYAIVVSETAPRRGQDIGHYLREPRENFSGS